MKNSTTKAALIFALFAATLSAKAQTITTVQSSTDGIKLSVGAESGISFGNFKDTHKTNIGGSLQADFPVASQFYATVNAGYVNFFGKDNVLGSGIAANDVHLLPLMAGLKYFPVGKLYIQVDAGAAFALNKSNVGYTSTAAFLYAPQVGYQFQLGGKSFLDAGVRYEGTTSFDGNNPYAKINQIGLRVAYGFGL